MTRIAVSWNLKSKNLQASPLFLSPQPLLLVSTRNRWMYTELKAVLVEGKRHGGYAHSETMWKTPDSTKSLLHPL